jgi:predicted dehydrogenase
MRPLIIGLGSMGKRRIRCFKNLGHEDIVGLDLREDRRKDAEEKYSIKTIDDIRSLNFDEIDAIIISTPPDKHNECIELAIEKKKPAFVEASVILKGLEELNNLTKKKSVFIAPSNTMEFHPAIKDIKNIVKSGKYGEVTNFSYHSGQYLPDWHPWENVKDFYVSKKETGACREIVPFELTWIANIVGFPKNIIGFHGKTMDVGADIDDTYIIAMDFGNSYGNITIDVVSRYATRSLILNMEHGQIVWRWDENIVKLYDAINRRWINYHYPEGQTIEGYNKNIIEDMYIDEIKSFIDAINGKGKFPNSLDEDIKILKLLHKVEDKLWQ